MYDINYKIIKQNYLQNTLGKISHKLLNGQNKLYVKSSNEFRGLSIHKIPFNSNYFPRKVKTIS